MEYIEASNGVFVQRKNTNLNYRKKYKKGDTIFNYDSFEIDYSNPDYQYACLIEYAKHKYHFLIIDTETKTLVDDFDTCSSSRDEAIDKFLFYCTIKNYKITLEIK